MDPRPAYRLSPAGPHGPTTRCSPAGPFSRPGSRVYSRQYTGCCLFFGTHDSYLGKCWTDCECWCRLEDELIIFHFIEKIRVLASKVTSEYVRLQWLKPLKTIISLLSMLSSIGTKFIFLFLLSRSVALSTFIPRTLSTEMWSLITSWWV